MRALHHVIDQASRLCITGAFYLIALRREARDQVTIPCMRTAALCCCLLRAMADDDETRFEVRRVQYGRMPLGPDQVFFKPCLIYQRLLDEHVVDAGLELRVDMTTGLKEARFNGGINITDEDRVRSILDRQLKCIDDNDEHARLGDGPTVARRLAAAASWGDAALTTWILQTCYVTVGQASEVLYAVAGQGGSPDVVDVLLRAGAELSTFDNGRTALHAALGNGHEEIAAALVSAATPDVVATAVELARANDFGPIARRIEARISPR